MSATLQTEMLMEYFSYDGIMSRTSATTAATTTTSAMTVTSSYYYQFPPKMIEIEGRTFPVQEYFLEHVLQLTRYINVEDLNDDDDDCGRRDNSDAAANNNSSNNVMSMDDLEAELAMLLNGGGGKKDNNGKSRRSMMDVSTSTSTAAVASSGFGDTLNKCVMCGKVFGSPSDLGVHIAMCTTGEHFDDNNGTDLPDMRLLDDGVHNEIMTTTNPTSLDLDEFEDYDEDGNAEVVDYQFNTMTMADHETAGSSSAVNNVKWDGTGEFQTSDTEFVVEDKTMDRLLSKYQSMHDDEQVDTTLLIEVLHYIIESSAPDGAILVFLPGWQEISELSMLLENTVPFRNRSKFLVLPLHSGIPSGDQRKVLRRPPTGVRKIVLSTNIAETSLTIDDVAFVVDAGRAKEKTYDPHLKTSTLQSTWISKSSARQRKGRAGRVRRGVCFHLFSSRRYENGMREHLESELLRTPLEEMCLLAKKLGLAPGSQDDHDGVRSFLGKAMSPPHPKAISNALELLVELGAMFPETNDLTVLGECLSVLSLEPRVGKMVIFSYLLGCASVATQMAVAMSYKSPFVLPPPKQRGEAEQSHVALSAGSESDQITVYNLMKKRDELLGTKKRQKNMGYSDMAAFQDYCRRNFLSPNTLNMIGDLRKNLSRELSQCGFPDPHEVGAYHNRHVLDKPLWQATIAAGLYPNLATRTRGDVNFSCQQKRKSKVHVSSVNSLKGQRLNSKCVVGEGEVEIVVYGEMVRGKSFFTLDNTTHLHSPLPLLLLCGTKLSIHTPRLETTTMTTVSSRSILTLDDWLKFVCPTDVARRLVVLRERLDSAFWNALSMTRSSSSKRMTMKSINSDSITANNVVLRNVQSVLTEVEQDALETLGVVLQEEEARLSSRKISPVPSPSTPAKGRGQRR
jgi:hypothetical protein